MLVSLSCPIFYLSILDLLWIGFFFFFIKIHNIVPRPAPCDLRVNSLPDNKILDWFKLKQIADDILKCI